MGFWENYKNTVETQKLRQEWIAEKAGMNYASYRTMCSKKPDIRLSTALKLARVIGVSLDYLADKNEAKASYVDMNLLRIAKKHQHMLEIIDSLPPDKLEFLKIQLESVAQIYLKTDMMVAEKETPLASGTR